MSNRKTGNKRRKNGYWFENFGPVPLAPCRWCNAPLTFHKATFSVHPTPGISCVRCRNSYNDSIRADLKDAIRRITKANPNSFLR